MRCSSGLAAIAGWGRPSGFAVLAHLQICQAALARAAHKASHAWAKRQIHERVDGVVDGMYNERDGCNNKVFVSALCNKLVLVKTGIACQKLRYSLSSDTPSLQTHSTNLLKTMCMGA